MLVVDDLGILLHHVELLMRKELVKISIGLSLVQDLWLKSAWVHLLGILLVLFVLDLGFFDQLVILLPLKMLLMKRDLVVSSLAWMLGFVRDFSSLWAR